jgi:hypothetical protein
MAPLRAMIEQRRDEWRAEWRILGRAEREARSAQRCW